MWSIDAVLGIVSHRRTRQSASVFDRGHHGARVRVGVTISGACTIPGGEVGYEIEVWRRGVGQDWGTGIWRPCPHWSPGSESEIGNPPSVVSESGAYRPGGRLLRAETRGRHAGHMYP